MENRGGGSDDCDRPSIGFPLGLALLAAFLICFSLFFSFCSFWDQLRALLLLVQPPSLLHDDTFSTLPHAASSSPPQPDEKSDQQKQYDDQFQRLTILMPGDDVPSFIAIPTSHGPPPPLPLRPENIIVRVQKS